MSFACLAYRLRCTPNSEYSAYYCPVNVPKWICFGEKIFDKISKLFKSPHHGYMFWWIAPVSMSERRKPTQYLISKQHQITTSTDGSTNMPTSAQVFDWQQGIKTNAIMCSTWEFVAQLSIILKMWKKNN